MKRRLLNLLTILPLLLCVAVVALWVRSFHYSHTLCWVRENAPGDRFTATHLMVARGSLHAGVRRWGATGADARPEDRPGLHHEIALPWHLDVNRLGFGAGAYGSHPGGWTAMPLWLVAVVAAAPTAARTLMWKRRRLRKPPGGLCLRCGYDLRATLGRCPECGTVAMTPA
jgi:hypothetical protein